MQPLTVVKFGGSTWGKGENNIPIIMDRIRAIRKTDGIGPVVVVSTLPGITNEAIGIGTRYAQNNFGAESDPLASINDRYLSFVTRYLGGEGSHKQSFYKERGYVYSKQDGQSSMIIDTLNTIKRNRQFKGIDRARLLAYTGERLTDVAFSYVLRRHGMETYHYRLDTDWQRDWPIVTDGRDSARFLFKESKERIGLVAKQLEGGKIPVIGGFIGVTTDGIETTYERGGSDRTAIDLGMLLKSESNYNVKVDFEKEVPVMSADPRIVEKPKFVSHMSYNELTLAGRCGMKIIDPVSIRDMEREGIDVDSEIVDLYRPTFVTEITKKPAPVNGGSPVKVVTGKGKCAIAELDISKRDAFRLYLKGIALYDDWVELSVDENKGRARFLFMDNEYVKDNEEILMGYDRNVSIDYDVGVTTLIGDDMGPAYGIAANAFGALKDTKIRIKNFDGQGSTSRILIVTGESDVNETVRRVHGAKYN